MARTKFSELRDAAVAKRVPQSALRDFAPRRLKRFVCTSSATARRSVRSHLLVGST